MQRQIHRLTVWGLLLVACGCSAEATFSLNGVQFRKRERERERELQQQKDRRSSWLEQQRKMKREDQDTQEIEKQIEQLEETISKVEIAVQTFRAKHSRDLGDILVGLFGTPDMPRFPKMGEDVVAAHQLQDAAGRVRTDQFGNTLGLYREHCAHCHGITGDGRGPTGAFLNPYPRDYRMGLFKFKTTPGDVPPTDDDLMRILKNGIPDTAMPSFKLLSDPELDALVSYVKYLSIRGQVERTLIDRLGDFDLLNADDRLVHVSAKRDQAAIFDADISAITETVTEVLDHWRGAQEQVTEVPPPPQWKDDDERLAAIKRGRELFNGNDLKCMSCHGGAAVGDGELGNYDKWTEDWTKDVGINPLTDQEAVREFLAEGAHPPRPVRPRNLRLGVYRGGRRPMDLFLRVKNGITGTPMPKAPATITDEDIWSVVEYVRRLPYEAISRPEHVVENKREVN